MARSALSIAIDMPFPVTGGIMVRASPIRRPEWEEAFLGVRESAAMELKEESSHTALFNRCNKRDSGWPESHCFQLVERLGTGDRERKRPQTLT
jgi:hypothetical protein